MDLFIDIGNTNIKFNFQQAGKEYFLNYETQINYTVDTFFPLLPKMLQEAKIKRVFICSVVPAKEALINGLFKKYFQIKPYLIAFPLKTNLQIKTNNPKGVGADLIALGAFLNSQSQERALIVNMGTATTLVLTEAGSFEGVIIAPGLTTSLNSLIKHAAKLNAFRFHDDLKTNIGRTTEEALTIGILHGHAAMIKAWVNKLHPAQIYLSGGLSRKIIKLLPEFTFVKEATIAGMKELVKINDDLFQN